MGINPKTFGMLHLPRVELHCKLREKLHRVTGPLKVIMIFVPCYVLESDACVVTLTSYFSACPVLI